MQAERGAKVAQSDRRLQVVLAAMETGKYRQGQLETYLRWVFTSDDRWPSWMRKPGRTYLDVANLFRASHLRDHLGDAESWASASQADPPFVAHYGDRTWTG